MKPEEEAIELLYQYIGNIRFEIREGYWYNDERGEEKIQKIKEVIEKLRNSHGL